MNTNSETEYLQVYNILLKEHVAFPSKDLFPTKSQGRMSIMSSKQQISPSQTKLVGTSAAMEFPENNLSNQLAGSPFMAI